MARTKLSANIVSNSDILRYLYQNFSVKEINTGEFYHESLYKFFYINGGGLPPDSVSVDLEFIIDLNGKIRCKWMPNSDVI